MDPAGPPEAIHYHPVGVVHSPFMKLEGMPLQPVAAPEVRGTVEIHPQFAPGLKDLDTIRTVVSSVTKPVNVVMTHADPSLTAADLAAVGVKRISVGGSISRFVLNAFMTAAREMSEHGAFTFVGENPPWKALLDGFAKGQG